MPMQETKEELEYYLKKLEEANMHVEMEIVRRKPLLLHFTLTIH